MSSLRLEARRDPVIRAYLFALEPTEAQAEQFRSHCGAQRFAYNWCLAKVLANWAQRQAEQSYGLSGDQLTPWVDTSAYSLRKAWNATKGTVAPWWAENSKEAYASGCANLATALANRKAGHARMPRFKSKRGHPSCRFTTGSFGLGTDRRHIRLPVIGVIRTHESTRKLARKVDNGTARIRSASLSYQRGRWHVSFSVELPDIDPAPRTRGRVVGVDLGIKSLAVLSTGEVVANPRHLDGALAEIRRASRRMARRQGPDRSRRQDPSNRWCKAKDRVGRLHVKVAKRRRDGLHQLTTRLVREFDTIVIEDLHVAGLLRNRSVARQLSDLGMGEIRRQLTYKAEWSGVRLIVADRWFASSKTCSGCGTAKTKLALSERTYVCMTCGIVLDRDVNAALNLAALAAPVTGELRREQPDGTGVRRVRLAERAVRPPREGRESGQRHHREAVAR